MAKGFYFRSLGRLVHRLSRDIAVATFLVGLPPSLAQWSSDPNINTPISTAGGSQQVPAMVSDGARGAIITWQDTRTTILPNIYAQRVNITGNVQWTPNGVAISVGQTMKQFPRISTDDASGAIITWIDSPPQPNLNWDIYAQRVDVSGTAQWIANGIPIVMGPARQQVLGAVVGDGFGGAIITWTDDRSTTTIDDIYAQRVNALGVVQWTANGNPISTSSQNQQFPVIASDGVGGAIIAWEDDRTTIGKDIYAQRVNSLGTTHWTTNGVAISTATGQQEKPGIIGDGAGGAIITWQDSRLSGCRLYAQRIDSSGNVQWAVNGVRIPQSTCSYHAPLSDGAGGAIIAWAINGVYAQRISAGGTLLWDSNGVALSTAPGFQEKIAIVSDGSGGAIVTWADSRNDPGNNITDIYAQRVSGSGVAQWTLNGVTISTAAGSQSNPAIVSDGAGGAIITWEDFRSGTNYDIYAQQVSANGVLGQVTSTDDKETLPFRFALYQNYPNPFNPLTTIEFELSRFTSTRLVVVNVLSQEVATLVNGSLPPGRYRETFNAINLPSGVYFYKLQTGEVSIAKKMLLLR